MTFIEERPKSVGISRVTDRGASKRDPFTQVDAIAAYYDVKPEKLVRQGSSAELDILRLARSGNFNLIVLGVSRRAGEKLRSGC